jgi:D-alanyl-D-alanine carboxypeptidase (penicillin-binding protein 5/6)
MIRIPSLGLSILAPARPAAAAPGIDRQPPGGSRGRRWTATLLALTLALAAPPPALAKPAAQTKPAQPAAATPAPPATGQFETPAREAILVDADTGAVLYAKNPDTLTPPASMSKMMTAYMIFEALKEGRIQLDDMLTVSENAWRKGGAASGGSTMFLALNSQVKVEDLIRGVIIQSGNDACIVLAEALAGSEEAFSEKMTRRGQQIGLKDSVFRNATGLPDPDHLTTARDLALLAKRTIQDFPDYYAYYAEREFQHGAIKQGNRNPLLYRNMGADGLKTGHTKAAGYGLTASAKQGDRRLILVVTGLGSMQQRADESERLMAYGFREFDNYTLFKAGETVATAPVWLGTAETVPIVAPTTLVVTLPRKARPEMKVTVSSDQPIAAPIEKGAQVGTLLVTAPGFESATFPLVAGEAVARKGFFGRIFASVGYRVSSLWN